MTTCDYHKYETQMKGTNNMKFDFVIGNPPYQESKNDTRDAPVYNRFMSEAYKIGDKVELITPARFLFNAGATPKVWNAEMLQDEHLKVLKYWQDSALVFSNTDIKGGVAVTYRDIQKEYGAIEIFSSFPELNSIRNKVTSKDGNLSNIVYSSASYRISESFHNDFPNESKKLKPSAKKFFATNFFEIISDKVLFNNKKAKTCVGLFGRNNNERITKYIEGKYVKDPGNLNMYKVFVPKSNGTGAIGEVPSTPLIGQPLIGQPLIGHTQSFISIGSFKSQEEANACMKYIKSKFARTMLGILKITQDNPPEKWKYVPLQDFTSKSDIDWSKSIKEIDKQLYKKYKLSKEEIDFIEQHVKEMN